MLQPLYFGPPQRTLFGIRHVPADGTSVIGAMTVAPPLLQEGISTQRALWQLCEQLGTAGVASLRFDWYGNGDAGGSAHQMTVDGLAQDAAAAMAWSQSQGRARTLCLRTGALGVLLAASRAGTPVDLVLWEPVLDGAAMCDDWERMHRAQVDDVGRYPFAAPAMDEDERLGFDLDAAFLRALRGIDARDLALPPGSRVLVTGWTLSPATQAWIERRVAEGVRAEWWPLETGDAPDWNDPAQFENQVFPRRGVAKLAGRLAEAGEWG